LKPRIRNKPGTPSEAKAKAKYENHKFGKCPMLSTYFVYKPGYRPYIMSENSIIQDGGSARNGVANQVQLCPVWLQQAANVQAMTVTATTGSAGTNCRLGLYRDASGTPAGGALITESANISAASAVNKRFVFSSNMRLEAGYVWCAFETQDATVAYRGTANNLLATPSPTLGCVYDTGSFGNLTNPCPAVSNQPSMAPIFSLVLVEWL
jgi:hypothetical protein